MSTEEWGAGYDEGYMKGWNDAMDEKPAQTDWEAVAADQAMTIALLKAEQPAQQEPVERGGLRFYTNGIERQHWKADGSIDFKDKQGNVTMTIAAGSITSSQPSKPLTDEQIMEMYNKVGGATWISDFARAIEAAHGIKENT